MVKYNRAPVVRIFTSFDWATGDIIVDIMVFLQTLTRGQNGTWNVGAKWHCGEQWNGAKWHHAIFPPKSVSFCPNTLVRFTPRPFHPRKFQWRKWLNGSRKRKLTHCGRAANLWTRVIIVLDNDLSNVKRHIIILIDTDVFPFVQLGKRYNAF